MFHHFHFKYVKSLKNMFIFLATNFFTCSQTIKHFFARKFFFKIFKIAHIFKRINRFCLTRSNTLLPNFWLKYLKSSLPKFLTKLSNEILRNWKLSIKLSLFLTLKLIYFSNPFSMIIILRLNFLNSCIIRCESYIFRLSNTTGILWFNLT